MKSRDGKSQRRKSEDKVKEEERRRKKINEEKVRKKKIQAREKVEKSRNTVCFPMICGSSRVEK